MVFLKIVKLLNMGVSDQAKVFQERYFEQKEEIPRVTTAITAQLVIELKPQRCCHFLFSQACNGMLIIVLMCVVPVRGVL